ncbi:TPA: hypothetical protein ENS27_17540 [bacterium]|nr:hypothetical protein [bacterium]
MFNKKRVLLASGIILLFVAIFVIANPYISEANLGQTDKTTVSTAECNKGCAVSCCSGCSCQQDCCKECCTSNTQICTCKNEECKCSCKPKASSN